MTRTTQRSGVRRVVALALACAAGLGFPGGVSGGEWHIANRLTCGECHTMHNSERGNPMRYDGVDAPAGTLLRAATATAVCLACHGGQRASAPNVLVPTNGDPRAGGFVDPAAGLMQHTLGLAPVFPPGGTRAVVMKCTTCHDPHGNGQFRNLRPNPSGAARINPPVVVSQAVTANGVNPGAVYTRANVLYRSGISEWCRDCHDALTEGDTGHSWDKPITETSILVSFAAWSRDPAALSPPQQRVPVQNSAGAAAPSTEDRVFCLSCHKAHGSPNVRAMVYSDGVTIDSTCQQCHDQ